MYHPSRGGVRGGTDQFSWDTVKTDKHRENYLGHSVMAPVGRWQKGKDLAWYSKERQNEDPSAAKTRKRQEMSAVKKAEEEAMLVALGFKPAKKEQHTLNKEDMAEVLRRNHEDRETMDIERIQGVGIESSRAAMLLGSGNKSNKGVAFEFRAGEKLTGNRETKDEEISKLPKSVSSSSKCSKKRKKDKKIKKKKKNKNRHSCDSESDNSDNDERKDRMEEVPSKHSKKHKAKKRHRHCSSEKEPYPVDNIGSKKYSDSKKEFSRKCGTESDSDDGKQHRKRRFYDDKKSSRREKHSTTKRVRHDSSDSD